MNIANYLQGNRYPLSTQGLDFIQNQVLTVQRLCAVLGVGKWIIDGCEESTSGGETTIAAGTVVINKEIVNVDQQTKNATCYIREVQNTTPRRVTRTLIFGSSVDTTQNLTWSQFERVDISALATKLEVEALRNLVLPRGSIIMWSGTVNEESAAFPAGFKICDGRNIEGFGLIPDLRGRFIVGYDASSAGSTCDYSEVGNDGGAAFVTLTKDQSGLPTHHHTTGADGATGNDWTAIKASHGQSHYQGEFATNSVGHDASESHENRPPYYTLAFLIKII